jgi:site-specific DNA recombinase
VEAVDDAIIEWIQENLLQERLVLVALKKLRARLEQRGRTSEQEIPKLEAEGRKLKAEIGRLTQALVSTDEKPEAVVRAMAEREKRLTRVRAQIEVLRSSPAVVQSEVGALEQEARKRLQEFKALLGRNPVEARKVVEAMLDGPLSFSPTEGERGTRRYRIEGKVRGVGALLLNDRDPSGIRTRVHALKGHCPGPG